MAAPLDSGLAQATQFLKTTLAAAAAAVNQSLLPASSSVSPGWRQSQRLLDCLAANASIPAQSPTYLSGFTPSLGWLSGKLSVRCCAGVTLCPQQHGS